MPHDLNGELIQTNDIVWVKCLVESVGSSEEACNVTVHPAVPPLGSTYNPVFVLNTQQVAKNPGGVARVTWVKDH